ncbi:MAG: ribose-5-phosphate isomerase RpiA [Hyphomicrobiaceae bacterium]|nr:ribose-5-phosphate isomerase RpiA [Hyphomicrobiaceae bacterium]
MAAAIMDSDALKERAAERALDYVSPGMRLGLGTGSTAAKFVDLLGAKVAGGLDVLCVPTSEATHKQAAELRIPLTTLEETPELDLTIDGADELDTELRLIKGGGGALLREKIVAAASARMVVIADDSKCVDPLGAFPLPVEIVAFGWQATLNKVRAVAQEHSCEGELILRGASDSPFVTDGGNYIVDCGFGAIAAPDQLAVGLSLLPGVVEHGLFIGIATAAIVAGEGGVEIIGEAP